jgi:hypothetical protein
MCYNHSGMAHKKTTMEVLKKTLLITLLPFLLVLYLFWSKGLPWLANHYHFALSGENGLPYEISYRGWSYQNLATCANADWCEVNQNSGYYKDYPVCMTEADIKKANQWPLVKIASMWTLGESPQPILVLRFCKVLSMGANGSLTRQETASGLSVESPWDRQG